MDLLRALNIFRRAAERGSFALAARDLALSQAAISRAVQALERHYGMELVRRSTRRMTLTEAGNRLLSGGTVLLEHVQALQGAIVGTDDVALAGGLRMTAPSGFGTLVLAPLVARFSRLHPAVRTEMLCTDRYLDLVEENIDLAFRVGLLEDSTLRRRVIAQLPEVLVAAPVYLQAAPPLMHPDDLADHPFIGLSILRGQSQRLCLSGSDGHHAVTPDNRTTFDTPLAVRQALLAGGGIGRIHLYMVADDLAAGRLEPVLPAWRCPTWTMSALKTARMTTQVAEAFLQLCETEFARTDGFEAV